MFWEIKNFNNICHVEGESDSSPGICIIDLNKFPVCDEIWINNHQYFQTNQDSFVSIAIDPMNDMIKLEQSSGNCINVTTEFLAQKVIIERDKRDIQIYT